MNNNRNKQRQQQKTKHNQHQQYRCVMTAFEKSQKVSKEKLLVCWYAKLYPCTFSTVSQNVNAKEVRCHGSEMCYPCVQRH